MARRHNLRERAPFAATVLAASLGLSCSGSPPRDINFGTDAGAGFEAPVAEVATDSASAGTDTGGTSAADGPDETTPPDADQDASAD
jgi:hypothetical protein